MFVDSVIPAKCFIEGLPQQDRQLKIGYYFGLLALNCVELFLSGGKGTLLVNAIPMNMAMLRARVHLNMLVLELKAVPELRKGYAGKRKSAWRYL